MQFSNRELSEVIDCLDKVMDTYSETHLNELISLSGVYYYLSEDEDILLKTNIFENETLEEEDFPDFAYLLYLYDVEKHPEHLAAIQSRPDIFIELRTWHD